MTIEEKYVRKLVRENLELEELYKNLERFNSLRKYAALRDQNYSVVMTKKVIDEYINYYYVYSGNNPLKKDYTTFKEKLYYEALHINYSMKEINDILEKTSQQTLVKLSDTHDQEAIIK